MSVKNDKEFDAKLMNFDGDRYDVVVLASVWAKELKKKDEYKNQPNAVVTKCSASAKKTWKPNSKPRKKPAKKRNAKPKNR